MTGRAGRVSYGRAVVRAICARAAAGESLRAIGRDPAMPAFRTIVKWAAARPRFARRLFAARLAAGGPLTGRRSSYCAETAQAIFERLCEGEGMVAICHDPAMPAYSTAWKWKQDVPEFAEAVAMAREIQAERLFEQGREISEAITPATAIAARVRLAHLRWEAGKLAPKTYGPATAAEAEPPRQVELLIRSFRREIGPDGKERVVAYCPDPVTRQMVREG